MVVKENPDKKKTLKNKPTPLKREAPFQEMIPKKKLEKLETVMNNCASIIKQHWKKMAEIPQECNFITWSNQNFA